MKLSGVKAAPDFIPLDGRRRPLFRIDRKTMSSQNGWKKKSQYVTLDRNLLPRVRSYLNDNKHLKFIDVDRMSDHLQASYPDYGRRKKVPFRLMVRQGNEKATRLLILHIHLIKPNSACLAYEEIKESLGPPEEVSDSDEEEEKIVSRPIEVRDPANESMRSFYSSGKDVDDIMVIDVEGDRGDTLPTSTPAKAEVC